MTTEIKARMHEGKRYWVVGGKMFYVEAEAIEFRDRIDASRAVAADFQAGFHAADLREAALRFEHNERLPHRFSWRVGDHLSAVVIHVEMDRREVFCPQFDAATTF